MGHKSYQVWFKSPYYTGYKNLPSTGYVLQNCPIYLWHSSRFVERTSRSRSESERHNVGRRPRFLSELICTAPDCNEIEK